MDIQKVPESLHSLVPFVQRWGAISSDREQLKVVAHAEKSDDRIAELESWAARWTPEIMAEYTKWENQTRLTDSYELQKFYFLFILFDQLEIDFPRLHDRRDPIAEYIADLQTFDQVGAKARRMFGARFLCDYEGEAAAAITALTEATSDPEDEVRAWAHAALAAITGDSEEHRDAIRAILESPTLDEVDRLSIEEALNDGERTSTQRAIDRLRSAALGNDLDELRKIVPRVDVNVLDHNGTTAVEHAVRSNHPEALEILLEAGADANQRCQDDGRTLLHMAAVRRRGDVMIQILLRHNADPRAEDANGQTPLDIAREKRRTKSIALLKAAMH